MRNPRSRLARLLALALGASVLLGSQHAGGSSAWAFDEPALRGAGGFFSLIRATDAASTGISAERVREASVLLDVLPEWNWPVAPPRRISRSFLAPATPYAAGHRGIDIELSPGATVYAPADGTVHFSGRIADRSVLSIAHDSELLSSFEAVTSPLRAGDTVNRGDAIAVLSDGGHCEARCLHFGVRLRGEYISPLHVLGDIPRAVLLPWE